MTNHVSGRHMIVGDALTEYVIQHLLQIERKYIGESIANIVVFSKAAKGMKFECKIRITSTGGIILSGYAANKSVYSAFNTAFAHISRQSRRTKTQLCYNKAGYTHKHEALKPDRIQPDDFVEIFDIPALYGNQKTTQKTTRRLAR